MFPFTEKRFGIWRQIVFFHRTNERDMIFRNRFAGPKRNRIENYQRANVYTYVYIY